jgi:hypothetical protein
MDISGHFVYRNLAISQNPNIETVFNHLLPIINPSRILEIGTFHGGLTLMIRDILDQNNLNSCDISTYDIVDPVFLKPICENKSNIHIHNTNIFNDRYDNFLDEETHTYLKNYLQQDGISLVLCDGGCKKIEFRLFSELLKPNDIIMAHDYAPDKEFFRLNMRDKIWNWHEIQDEDIEEACIKYNLKPYMKDELLSVAWVGKQKYQ